jgi:hypothetical protein
MIYLSFFLESGYRIIGFTITSYQFPVSGFLLREARYL